jgi:tetratricopeptide (TPR) repeat protein
MRSIYRYQRMYLLSFCIYLSCGIFPCIYAQSTLPGDMHAWAIAAIDHIYSERFRAAEDEARKIIKKYPAHPAGFFFMAAAIDAWMSTHFSDKRENEFYRFCDLAVEKGDKMLEKNGSDPWVRFFIGGAEGYKGTYEARFGRWITAFRYGWKGVSILMQLSREQNSYLTDINFGIGSYEYWRSAMMKSLRWMPGVEDKRAQGIEKLLNAHTVGVYTRLAAAAGLIDIYLNEKAFAQAIAVADEALIKYPDSRWLLIGKARAHLGAKNYEASKGAIRRVLARAEKEPSEEHATIAVCHFWLAKIECGDGSFAECIAECDLMKTYQFDDDSRKQLENYYDELESIKKQAIIGRKSKGQTKLASEKPETVQHP